MALISGYGGKSMIVTGALIAGGVIIVGALIIIMLLP
jgi:hypothetical protein